MQRIDSQHSNFCAQRNITGTETLPKMSKIKDDEQSTRTFFKSPKLIRDVTFVLPMKNLHNIYRKSK